MAVKRPEPPSSVLRWIRPAAVLGGVVLLFTLYPPFRVVSLNTPPTTPAPVAFDAVAAASGFWETSLQPAARTDATELTLLLHNLRADPERARTTHGRTVGIGGRAYYFARGSGRVVGRERNLLLLEPTGAPGIRVALRTGPVFGNTVRDASGQLDVNAFPGLSEFNALAAELNRLVEERVLPSLRADLPEGALIEFAGAAEVPAALPADGARPLLAFIPVRAELR